MNIRKIASITGLSVRALQYYDKVGLLCPLRDQNEYRMYSDDDLDMLQQILLFKECGFTLAKIKALLANPSFNRETAFEIQKNYLLKEKKRINTMLETLEKTKRSMKGEITMSQKEKFKGFDFSSNLYEEEARRLWGNKVVDESNARIASMSSGEQNAISEGMDDLFTELAKIRNKNPESNEVQISIGNMYQYFNQNFGNYSLEAFAGLGKMYVEDNRFTQNIDKYGAGLSKFLMESMAIYAKNNV